MALKPVLFLKPQRAESHTQVSVLMDTVINHKVVVESIVVAK